MNSFKSFIGESVQGSNGGQRIRIIKTRLRRGANGKITVQRRKKVSGIKGYTLKGGTLRRISAQERLHRRLGARRAKVKRRGRAQRSLLRRKITLRRRHAMGLP
ncbi:hypothetical protein UFOVP49_198 [uncultured Caudovirales phage]|uniref:Uncharacterized protein n=1 Tax=uncultured Caudovirales phage TaxID=2100421 RepID=A0A6J5KVV5_9CAUD|nr:hypothetical protein UFOVP49_198 [uncultured Caudovirales phage]